MIKLFDKDVNTENSFLEKVRKNPLLKGMDVNVNNVNDFVLYLEESNTCKNCSGLHDCKNSNEGHFFKYDDNQFVYEQCPYRKAHLAKLQEGKLIKTLRGHTKGIEDIVETMGTIPEYVVSEFLKVPQLAEAYRKLGLRYAGLNSGMPEADTSAVCCSGMYAYAGPLFGMERAPFEGRLAEGLSELRELLEKRPPAIKIFMHPYKLLYNSPVQAWYGKNNFYRHYDPAANWDPPVISRYTPEVTELLTDEFFALFDLVSEYDVEYVSTADHLSQYLRPAGLTVERTKVESLWSEFKQKHTYLRGFTPAEITAMKCFSLRYPDAHEIPVRTVGGPADTLIPDPACSVKDADIFFEYSGRMPDRITPELFVCDLPKAAVEEPEYRLTEWTRDIYPADFTGKEICRFSTLQSWGFRPAEKFVQG